MDTFSQIANYLTGASSEQEKEALEAWRREKPEHEAEFRKFEKIWNAGEANITFSPNVDFAWQKVQQRISPEQQAPIPQARQVPLKPYRQRLLSIAAAVALLIIAGSLFWIINSQTDNSATRLASLQTGENERREIVLADGTQIWLNENTTLQYPETFTDSIREVHLKGEALFQVARMPEKPFVIMAEKGYVQVLGTTFNFRAGKELAVQVSEGRVKVAADQAQGSSLILEAGEGALLRNRSLVKTTLNPNYLAWKTGHFLFEGASLQEVLTALERYYPVSFVAENQKVLKCRIHAEFRQQPLEEVLQVIGLTMGLEFKYQADKGNVLVRGSTTNCKPIQ